MVYMTDYTKCEANIKNKTLERAAILDLREKFSFGKHGVGGGNHPPLGQARVKNLMC